MATPDWRETLIKRVLRLASTLHLDRLIHAGRPSYPFTDYFKGLEKVEAVRRIFEGRTEEVLGGLKVEFMPFLATWGSTVRMDT